MFGASHSAILVLKTLTTLPIHKIINFYTMPLRYACKTQTGKLYAFSGLKALSAQWAKQTLEQCQPHNLVRIKINKNSNPQELTQCTKVIYAIGFEPNDMSFIVGANPVHYDSATGIITNHLFGIGIAFPESYIDQLGHTEYKVGLKSFMEFAKRTIPLWLKVAQIKE